MKWCLVTLIVIAVLSWPALVDDAAWIAPLKGNGANIEKENALIFRLQDSMNGKNWRDVETMSNQLIAMNPDRWEYWKALGDAQFNLVRFQHALETYEKALTRARKLMGRT
jgi:cytochrome c-type biogenesis protein CcmH/NrfG